MAEVTLTFWPDEAHFDPGIAGPQFSIQDGSNYATYALLFDGASTERCFFPWVAVRYPGSGDVSVDIYWFAVSATSGTCVWEVALAALTPDSDSTGIVAKSFATAATVVDTHLGTTAARLHKATITLSGASLDSLANRDWVVMRVSRLPTDASDTITTDLGIAQILVRYSD